MARSTIFRALQPTAGSKGRSKSRNSRSRNSRSRNSRSRNSRSRSRG